jgi:hypothetical protein
MRIRARNIARDWRLDANRCQSDLQEAINLSLEGQPGGLQLGDFSIRDLMEELLFDQHGDPVGYEFVKNYCNPSHPISNLQEAFTAVDSTAFLAVTEQLLIREVLAAYRNPAFVLSNVIPNIPTPFIEGEVIPGMTLPKNPETDQVGNTDAEDDALVVGEAEEYPVLGFGEDGIRTPATKKRGAIIALTREMLFRDRTGLAVSRAQYVGTLLAQSKERRITDVVIGAVNTYKERRLGDSDFVTRRTYYGAGDTSPPWINHVDANQIQDYTALDVLDNMIADMEDPNTGEPIVVGGRDLLYMPPIRSTIFRVLNAIEVREVTNSGNRTTIGGNPARQNLRLIESVWAYRRLQDALGIAAADAKNYYFYGDLARAFAYLENWGIELSRQGRGSDMEFWQDIVVAFKGSERGTPAVIDPRYVFRARAVASSSSGA